MLEKALEVWKNASSFALLGASTDKEKYGYRLFLTCKERYKVYPINPKREEVEGERC